MKVLTKADFIAICRKIVAQMAAREQNKKGVPHRVSSFAAFVDDMQPSVNDVRQPCVSFVDAERR